MGDRGIVGLHAPKHRRADDEPRATVEPRVHHATVLDSDRRLPALVQAFLASAAAIDPNAVELGYRHVKRHRNVNGNNEISWTEREQVIVTAHVVWDEDPSAEEAAYGGRLIRGRAVLVASDGRVYARLEIPSAPARPSTFAHADFLPGLRVDHEDDAHVWAWRDEPAPAGAIAFHATETDGPVLGVQAPAVTETWLLNRMADYLTEHNPAVIRRRPGSRPRPR